MPRQPTVFLQVLWPTQVALAHSQISLGLARLLPEAPSVPSTHSMPPQLKWSRNHLQKCKFIKKCSKDQRSVEQIQK